MNLPDETSGENPAAGEDLDSASSAPAEWEQRYPAEGFPYTHYFNGEAMPWWSNSWHLIPGLEKAEEMINSWGERITYNHLWRLECRMDHCGGVESEDPHILRVCCLALSLIMIRDEAEILAAMESAEFAPGGTPREIFNGVRDGLFAMHQRSLDDGIAFWTSGHESDRDMLRDAMRRHRLPNTDPDWFEPPHLWQHRFELEMRNDFLRNDIISLLGTRRLSKDVRRLIHSLPRKQR